VTHPRRGDGDRSGDGVRWAGRSAKGGGEAFGGGEVVVGERGEAIAAAICRPVAMPPAASTGTSRIGRIASTASGTSTNVVTSIDVFGELGWAGFTIEAVARRSRVGKAAIYLRWPSKAELLVAALRDRIGPITATDTDSARDHLVRLGRQILRLYLGDSGRALLRVSLESDRHPDLDTQYRELRDAQTRAARAVVRRGVVRGDLPPDTEVTLVLDVVCGGALMHALGTRVRCGRRRSPPRTPTPRPSSTSCSPGWPPARPGRQTRRAPGPPCG